MEDNICYRIYAPDYGYEICRAKTIEKLFELFCKAVYEHNSDIEELSQELKDEIDFDNARVTFRENGWQIESGRIIEKMVFDD